MSRFKQGFRVELNPRPDQRVAMGRHAGLSRFVENFALDKIRAAFAQRAAEQTYGIPQARQTEAPWSAIDLEKLWRAEHATIAPWFAESGLSSRIPKQACRLRAAGLKNWWDSQSGKRKGPKLKFPTLRKRKHGSRFRYDAGRAKPSGANTVSLPGVPGKVATREPLDWLTGRLGAGRARIIGCTVREKAGRWWVTFQLDIDRTDRDAHSLTSASRRLEVPWETANACGGPVSPAAQVAGTDQRNRNENHRDSPNGLRISAVLMGAGASFAMVDAMAPLMVVPTPRWLRQWLRFAVAVIPAAVIWCALCLLAVASVPDEVPALPTGDLIAEALVCCLSGLAGAAAAARSGHTMTAALAGPATQGGLLVATLFLTGKTSPWALPPAASWSDVHLGWWAATPILLLALLAANRDGWPLRSRRIRT